MGRRKAQPRGRRSKALGRRKKARVPVRAVGADTSRVGWGSVVGARVVIALYVLWVIVVPPRWLSAEVREVWRLPQQAMHRFVAEVYGLVGIEEPTRQLQAGGFYVVSAFMVPWVVMALLGRGRPKDLGWRRPNRLLLRIVGCSFLISLPFLFWMVRSPGFIPYYRPYLEAGAVSLVCYYLVVLFCEHSFMEGVMLGAFRRGHRWPTPAKLVQNAKSGPPRVLQWIGLAQPTGKATGLRRVTRWFGLQDGCAGAIVLSGVLFGMVHWGKDGREFLLSFPGGVFLALLAYRCNSWHAPYILHASTVLAAGLMMLSMRS